MPPEAAHDAVVTSFATKAARPAQMGRPTVNTQSPDNYAIYALAASTFTPMSRCPEYYQINSCLRLWNKR